MGRREASETKKVRIDAYLLELYVAEYNKGSVLILKREGKQKNEFYEGKMWGMKCN